MTIKAPSPTLFAVALLLTEVIVASSGYAQNIGGLDSVGSTSAAATGLSTEVHVTVTSGDTFISIPALPPILGKRLKVELGIAEGNGNIGRSSPSQGANHDDLITLGKGRPPVHHGTAKTHRYFITDLGTLGGTQSFAYGINDFAQVVGFSSIAGDASGHSFLYSHGTMTDLYPLNSTDIRTVGPTGINNSGQIASGLVVDGVYSPAVFDSRTGDLTLLGSLGGVTPSGFSGVATSISRLGDTVGYSNIDATTAHAFLYFNALMTDIDSFGGYSTALDVNDAGTTVGFASTRSSGGRPHAFVYTSSGMTDIDPFGDLSESHARGINNAGQVVGEFLTQDHSAFHAFLYSDGAFYDLGSSQSPETVAFAINDRGRVVGVTLVPYEDVCLDPDTGAEVVCTKYTQHAFLYVAGNMLDLNTLIPSDSAWELVWAFDINSHGQIAGYGLIDDKFRAFLLTPAATKEQCKNRGWKDFGFKNQGQCIQFVNAGK